MALIACTMQSFARRVWPLSSDGSLSCHTIQASSTPRLSKEATRVNNQVELLILCLNHRHIHHKPPILKCLLGLKILERKRKQYILNQ